MSIVPGASKKMTFIRLQILSKGLPGSPLPGTQTAAEGSWEPIWYLWYRHLQLQCVRRHPKASLSCPRSAPGFDFPGTSHFGVDFVWCGHPMTTLITRTSSRQSMSSSTWPTTTSFPGPPVYFHMTRGDWILVMGAQYYLRAKNQCSTLKSSGFSLSKELLFNIIFLNCTENSGTDE